MADSDNYLAAPTPHSSPILGPQIGFEPQSRAIEIKDPFALTVRLNPKAATFVPGAETHPTLSKGAPPEIDDSNDGGVAVDVAISTK